MPVNAPTSGVVLEYFANVGDTVLVGQKLFKFAPSATPPAGSEAAAAPAPAKEAKKAEAPKAAAAAAPAAAPAKAAAPAPKAAAAAAPTASVTAANSRNERREKMSRMRLRIADRLKESQDTAASLTTFNEIDMRCALLC